MADNPTNPTNPTPQLDLNSIKKVQQELSVAQQQMQRLLVLQKALQLKLIDEKDASLFEKFLKQLASTDLSNLKDLSRYVKGGAVKFNELVSFSQQLNKESSVYVKGLIQQNNQFEQIYSNIQNASKSASGLNSNLNQTGTNVKKVNNNLKETNSLVDDFVEGYKEGLDNFDETVDLQAQILKGFDKLNDAQKKGISLGLEFSDTYTDFSKNLSESISKTDFRPTVSPVVELDFMGGVADKIMSDMQKVLDSFGESTFEIDGDVFDSSEMQGKLEALGKLYVETANKSKKIQESASEGIADYIATKFQITKDVALQLADDMIKDIAAKMQNPDANILSPERANEISDFYNKIKQSNDKALLSMISYTADASAEASLLAQEFDIVSNKIRQIPKIDKALGMPNRIISETLDTMQRGVRDTVPNFLYNILDLDGAFDKVRTSATQAMSGAAKEAMATGSVMKGVTSAVGGLSSSLMGALGPIGLIAIAVSGLVSLFMEAGSSVKEISNELGVSNATAYELYKNTLAMTAAVDNMSLKQEDVLNILKKHKDEYGTILDLNNEANQQAVKFSTQLGKQYGVAGTEVYGMTQQLQMLGADQQGSENMAMMAAYAADLAGISFSTITKDLSENSNFVAQAFAGMPQAAIATTVKLRAMGSSLKQMATTMDKMSDFNTFAKSNAELNMMTQGVVDLSKYQHMLMTASATSDGDKIAAQKELNKQIDKMIDSGQTSYFQMKQLEEVTGLTSEEMLKGNKLRKLQKDLGQDNVDMLGKYLDKMTDADLADAKSAMNAKKRFEAAEKFDAVWASIKDTLVQAVLPVLESIEPILSGILPIVKSLGVLIKGLAVPFAFIGDIIKMISGEQSGFKSLTDLFTEWNGTMGILSKTLMVVAAGFATYKVGSWLWKGVKGIGDLFKGFSGGVKGLKGITGGKGVLDVVIDTVTGNDQCECMQNSIADLAGTVLTDAVVGETVADAVDGGFGGTDTDEDGKKKGDKKGKKTPARDPKTGRFVKASAAPTPKGRLGRIAAFGANTWDMFKSTKLAQSAGKGFDALKSSKVGQQTAKGFDALKSSKVGQKTGDLFTAAKGKTAAALEKAKPTVTKIVDKTKTVTTTAIDKAKSVTTGAVDKTKDLATKIKDSKVGQTTAGVLDKTKTAASGLAGKIQSSGVAQKANTAFEALSNSKAAQAAGKAAKVLGPVAAIAGAGLEYSARKEQGQTTTQAAAGTAAGAAGAWAGGLGGAKLGAVIGTAIMPGIGTAIGGFVGGIGGGIAGWWAAGKAADTLTGVGEKQGEKIGETAAQSVTDGLSKQDLAKKQFPEIYKTMDKIDASMKKLEEEKAKKAANRALEQGKKLAGSATDAMQRGMEIATSKSVMKGLDESELSALETAGYSEEIIKQLNEGTISIQDAIQQHAKNLNVNISKDQLDVISNPFSEKGAKYKATSQMAGMPSLDIGTDMVNSDGLAMLHKGESVVPADVDPGGYKGKSFEQNIGELGIDMMKSKAFQMYFGGMKVAKAAMQYPTSETGPTLGEVTQQTTTIETQQSAPQTTAPAGNQEAVLKQILSAINGLAQRPIAVNFGGTDLKTINSKLKVYNNI